MTFILPLILYCIATTLTPGPNNFMSMLSAVRFGLLRSLPHFLGICFGFPIMVIVIGIGLRDLYVQYPQIHEIIKYIGAVYMAYLGLKIMLASTRFDSKVKKNKPMSFFQGILFQWVNPKAWVMAIAAVSTYTTVSGNISLQIFLIALIYFITTVIFVGLWYVGGANIKHILKNEFSLKCFNISMGILLLISIILIFID